MKSFAQKILFLLGTAVFIWFSFPFNLTQAQAGGARFTGWAWSENIGWLSFNSNNCDTDGNGLSDGVPAGCPIAGAPMAQYAVARQPNGDLTGYAWSENIGWVRFDPPGPYPGSPNKSSRVHTSQPADGWFRALATDASWDGWMKFDSGGNYGSGVTLGGAQGNILQGYAWGSDVVGWIHMNGTAQSGAPYQVSLIGGQITNLSADTTGSGAVCSSAPTPTISWTYTNPLGLSQSAYQVQIATDSGFGAIVVDSGKVPSSSTSYIVAGGVLNYNTLYFYRVRVWDTNDSPSGYAQSSFTTPAHRGPTVDFTWTPPKPIKGADSTFTDTTTFSGGATFRLRSWTFPSSARPQNSPQSPVTVQFQDSSNIVILSVTDTDSLTCSLQRIITVITPIQDVKEVK